MASHAQKVSDPGQAVVSKLTRAKQPKSDRTWINIPKGKTKPVWSSGAIFTTLYADWRDSVRPVWPHPTKSSSNKKVRAIWKVRRTLFALHWRECFPITSTSCGRNPARKHHADFGVKIIVLVLSMALSLHKGNRRTTSTCTSVREVWHCVAESTDQNRTESFEQVSLVLGTGKVMSRQIWKHDQAREVKLKTRPFNPNTKSFPQCSKNPRFTPNARYKLKGSRDGPKQGFAGPSCRVDHGILMQLHT